MTIVVNRTKSYVGHPMASEAKAKIPCVHATLRERWAWWQVRYYPPCASAHMFGAHLVVNWPEVWAFLRNDCVMIGGRAHFGMVKPIAEEEFPPGMGDQLRAAMITARLNNQI